MTSKTKTPLTHKNHKTLSLLLKDSDTSIFSAITSYCTTNNLPINEMHVNLTPKITLQGNRIELSTFGYSSVDLFLPYEKSDDLLYYLHRSVIRTNKQFDEALKSDERLTGYAYKNHRINSLVLKENHHHGVSEREIFVRHAYTAGCIDPVDIGLFDVENPTRLLGQNNSTSFHMYFIQS